MVTNRNMTARWIASVGLFLLGGACTSVPALSTPPAPPTPVPEVRPLPLLAQPLTPVEIQMRDAVRLHYNESIALLERAVNIPSGSLNRAGVKRVGDLFAAELRGLGFETEWVAMPDSIRRAGHLVAIHRGTLRPRLLLIGHLDTVFEGDGQRWVQEDTIARGAGTSDMKGGDVAMILALRALSDAGRLKDMHVTVVMTGDEESTGQPLSVSRAALLEAARNSDLALVFEGGTATRVAISRRGASSWSLTVNARQAHSSGIFSEGAGFGAAYEGVRILDEFRRQMAGERGLTFNIGIMASGANVVRDTVRAALVVDGKHNIIPPVLNASGDLRFLTEAQKDSARARMRAIVARPLAQAQGTITFEDRYPAMPVTAGGERLLAIFDATSRSLGYPSVSSGSPESRGAGDVSFVAPIIPGIDGLGVAGSGAHSPREQVYLPSIRLSAERAAVFMSRLVDQWK
ncbi:MAG TPA: M20/M25/M40 family metallo-hydrolase [Gemmatimonadaceae bacterium]|nr:M20/M25/M40 family metallo-hydrolase [Gemmatimonadaceae bacterium]